MDNVLITASVASMIKQFNLRNVEILQQQGFNVHIAANFNNPGTITLEQSIAFKKELEKLGITTFQIDFERGIGTVRGILKSISQIKKVLRNNCYSFIHTQATISSMIVRVIAHKYHVPVIYMAHGFQFYTGGSWLVWSLIYPLEYLLSYWTDLIITINDEDTHRAINKFHAKKVIEIPGVGINYNKFASDDISNDMKKDIRKKLGIPEHAFVITSVGELSKRKNQEIIIRALNEYKNKNIYYIIAGIGNEEERLKQLVTNFQMIRNIKFIGYRSDLHEIYTVSDIAAYPSNMEGLMISGMEAMANGVPLLYANVRGIKDYNIDGITGESVNQRDIKSVIEKIDKLYNMSSDMKKNMNYSARKQVKKYEFENIDNKMRLIYSSFIKEK